MKNRGKIPTLFLSTLYCLPGLIAQNPAPEMYELEIIQGKDTFPVKNKTSNTIYLNRSVFQFRFVLKSQKYVFFIASEDSSYHSTKPGLPFPVCQMFCGGAVGADVPLNPNRDMCIYGFSDGIECWYYDSSSEHRFDGIPETKGDTVYASRTVEKIYSYNKKERILLKKLKPGTTFFLVFFDMQNEPCEDCDSQIDAIPQRKYLKLIFR